MQSSKTTMRAIPPRSADLDPQNFDEPGTPKPRTRWRRKLDHAKQRLDIFLESLPVTIVMSVITIYALFADDVRQLITNITVDDGFYVTTSVCFGLFGLEIFLCAIAKPRYFLSFFFWLDIVSTLSLILDIGWISDAIFDTGAGSSPAAGAAQLARAGRASRVGTRAGRIVRIVRLVRLIRIVKLYKAAQQTLNHGPTMANPVSMVFDDDESNDDSYPTPHMSPHISPSAVLQNKVSLTKDIVGGEEKELRDLSPKALERHKVSIDHHFQLDKKQAEKSDKKPHTFGATSLQLLQVKAIEEANPEQEQGMDPGKRNSVNQGAEGEIEYKPIRGKTSSGIVKANKTKLDVPDFPQETNVGRKLSNLTTKRVITVVLSVLITIPVFTTDTYLNTYSSGESGLRTLYLMNKTGSVTAFNFALNNYIAANTGIRDFLITVDLVGYKWYASTTIDENALRDSEKQYYNIDDNEDNVTGYVAFDIRADTELNAILSITRTIFVTLVLGAAALSFSKDANDLVLSPIESMLVKVKRIAANPLAAAQIEEEDALLYEELAKQQKTKALIKKREEGNYETSILEKTILKLGALLAIGFGEAGSNIVAQNMSKSGEVDPMIPGKKVMGIFGFCDIRNFTDATEVLQEGVMVFVNEIAEIVHGTINEFSGAANKNIGDAFLLVWKIPPEEVEQDPDDESSLRLKKSVKVSQLADMSVLSFLKVIAGVLKSKRLEKYRHNEGLNLRLPNYSVKMGFGLHVGWAIEGAIGSEYKIDASYLSPNVNMAARLEAATKQFGVPLLISGALYDVCTVEMKKQLRQIDRVTVKGSNQPMSLFTCDVDFSRMKVDKNERDTANLTPMEKKKARVKSRLVRDELREKVFTEKYRVAKMFSTDRDLILMRQTFTRDFYTSFRDGFVAYTNGDWPKAKEMFDMTSHMLPGIQDGPSRTLLNVMKEHDYKAPSDWKGFRELTEK